MAKNYTLAELVTVVHEGKDLEAMNDVGKRYAMLTQKVAKITALAGEEFVDFVNHFPEYITANKINSALKVEVQKAEADEVEEATEEVEEKPKAKRGRKPKAEKAVEEEEIEEEDEADEEPVKSDETEDKYAGKSAMELYKECKDRGIEVKAKNPASYYKAKLNEADKAEVETDDEWDEEEAEEKKETKKAKSTKAKAGKKAKTKTKKAEKVEVEEETDDEDDEWDI